MARQGWQLQTLVLLQILYANKYILGSYAQLLSAYEQVYGPWNIKLTKNMFARRTWHLETLREDDSGDLSPGIRRKGSRRRKEDGDLQIIFPETQRKQLDESSSYKHATTKSVSVRSVPCILNLEKNGKFALFIEQDDCIHNSQQKPNNTHHGPFNNCATSHTAANLPTSLIHQPLKGEWYLTPNPYCVTDRHFDTLLLEGEPRMRKLGRSNIIEKATVELRCKVWGRYGIGAVRKKLGLKHGRVRGRMTHGTVTIIRTKMSDIGEKVLPSNREVVATFSGRTNIDFDSIPKGKDELSDNLEDDQEEEDFGDNFDEFGVLQHHTGQ